MTAAPDPGAMADELRAYFRGSARAARVNATGQLLATMAPARSTAGWLIPGGRFPGPVASGIAGVRLSRKH